MRKNIYGEWFAVLKVEPGRYDCQAVIDGRPSAEACYAVPVSEIRDPSLIEPALESVTCCDGF